MIEALKAKFPHIQEPPVEDICYATTNRQEAVKAAAHMVDAFIVVGAANSSNSQRLREVAEREGCKVSLLAPNVEALDFALLEGARSVGDHRRRLGPGDPGRADPRRPRRALHAEGREPHHPRGEHVLSAAARPARGGAGGELMAVYTEVGDEALARFLDGYDLGAPLSLKGIAEGVENSNYLLHAERGVYLLTLYEKRVDEADLPFFLGLMEHLAKRGVNCPQPVRARNGEAIGRLAGRAAAIVTFLEGLSVRRPTVEQCGEVGEALAKMHAAGADFALTRRNALSIAGWPALFEAARARADEVVPGLARETALELETLQALWPQALPAGVIHADLFPDNVFFLGDRLSGLIDFYFACNDFLAYDLAICLNSWAFDGHAEFNPAKGRAMIAGYQSVRMLDPEEVEALPILARGSALRFMLTRLVDWLNVPPGALVKPKDPREYLAKLRFHAGVESRRRLRLALMEPRVEIWTDGACSGNPGPGGWGAILKFGARVKELAGRRGADHQQPHGAVGRDLRAGIADARLRRRSLHRFPISAPRHHGLAAQLEAQRLAHRRQEAGQERRPLAPARRGDAASSRSNGAGSRAMPARNSTNAPTNSRGWG